MSVFTCGRGPDVPMYCETCQAVSGWREGFLGHEYRWRPVCSHRVRSLRVGDRIKASRMQVDDGTMGTVDFVEPGRYGVTWDEGTK